MSPLPSPTPVRNAIVRLIFSPIGLLCGFVVLLITTCPGARGEDGLGPLGSYDGLRSSVVDLSGLDAPAATSRPAPAFGRSTRFDRAPVSSARSATPLERQQRERDQASADVTSFRTSRSALPLLSAPLADDKSRAPAANLTPMTGPAVGIRPSVPVAGR